MNQLTQAFFDSLFDFDTALQQNTADITGVMEKDSEVVDNDPLGLNDFGPWFGDDSDDE